MCVVFVVLTDEWVRDLGHRETAGGPFLRRVGGLRTNNPIYQQRCILRPIARGSCSEKVGCLTACTAARCFDERLMGTEEWGCRLFPWRVTVAVQMLCMDPGCGIGVTPWGRSE